GKTVTVVARPRPRTPADNVTDLIACSALIFFILVAATLVLVRPSAVTWAFYLFAFSMCDSGTLYVEYLSFPALFCLSLVQAVAAAAGAAALFSFALRFPDVPLRGSALAAERIVLFGVAPALAALNMASTMLYAVGNVGRAIALVPVSNTIFYGLFSVAVFVLLARYATVAAEERNRLRWMVAAMTVAFVPGLITGFFEGTLGIFLPIWWNNVAVIFCALAPMALAYTILKHRLFDIRLVVSRALVYGMLTTAIVALLALVEWIVHHWLEESRFAMVVELALAVFLGVLLTSAHRRVEHALNQLIFRAQVLALQALRRFTKEIDLIPDPQRLLTQTYDALRTRLDSDFVAIYAVEGSSFVLATPHSHELPRLFAIDDLAVLRLRGFNEAFECDEPQHPLRGSLLLPMAAHTQVVGFIACGPKRDRTHYLPGEVETLAALAHRSGSAYLWLTARQPAMEPVPTL
ncbi:MAG TPA: hypothetical protein VHS56_14665, partial [Candidatus Cybelea sp.]|nr:hypothetical protein [Candidatus Cybelea sp.]